MQIEKINVKKFIKGLGFSSRMYFELAVLLLILIVVILNGIAIMDRVFEYNIGYVDMMTKMRSFDRIINGEIPYRDFFYHLGPLLLYLQVPLYILLGQNHFANSFLLFAVLPAVSALLVYLWAKIFLKTPYFVFGLLIASYLQNLFWVAFPSIRILIPALAVAVFILSCYRHEKRYLYLSGLVVGISLSMSQEYGISALITIILAMIANALITRQYDRSIHYFIRWMYGILTILVPVVIFLFLNGALMSYLEYTINFVYRFGTVNYYPIPYFPSIEVSSSKNIFASLFTLVISRDFLFYLPLITYAVTACFLVLTIKKGWNNFKLSLLTLIIYGCILFVRPLSTPLYLVYAILPAMTIGFIFIESIFLKIITYLNIIRTKTFDSKVIAKLFFSSLIILASIFWLYSTTDDLWKEEKSIANLTFNPSHENLVFYDRAGYYLSPKSIEQYDNVIWYIENNTETSDFIYVYPWGPYNHFTKRPSPVKAEVIMSYLGQEKYEREIADNLEKKKPKYVILNLYNNLGLVGWDKRGDVHDYIRWKTPDSPAFLIPHDREPVVEKYILENYHTVKKFEYAAIMARNELKKEYIRDFEEVFSWDRQNKSDYIINELNEKESSDGFRFENNGSNPYIDIKMNRTVEASHISLKIRVKYSSLNGFFSKAKLYISTTSEQNINYTLSTLYPSFHDNKFHTFRSGFGGVRRSINYINLTLETTGAFNFQPEEIEIEYLKLFIEK